MYRICSNYVFWEVPFANLKRERDSEIMNGEQVHLDNSYSKLTEEELGAILEEGG